ncbi:MAG TPA: hypothetical protein VM580_32470 [Labilithrix sp.]|nr:hypothetical protein [Labilithrix sp.]
MRGQRVFVATVALGAASGCFALADLSRFDPAPQALTDDDGGTPTGDAAGNGPLSLRFQMHGMNPHPTEYFEYRIIDSANVIQSRGVANPLGANDVTINAPNSIPRRGGPYRIDFFADHNRSGEDGRVPFDRIGPITDDHAWRIEGIDEGPNPDKGLSVEGNTVVIDYVHDPVFTDIDTDLTGAKKPAQSFGLDATISFTGMDAYLATDGKKRLVEVRIQTADATPSLSCLYRLPSVKEKAFDMVVPGCVEPGASYRINVYIDKNGDGTYDNPAITSLDEGWTALQDAKEDGLNVTLDPATVASRKVDVGPP